MGQWLVIGIATRIVAEKREAKRHLFDDYEAKMKEMLSYRFNSRGIYDVTEDEDEVTLTLRDDVAKEQWISLVRNFYQLRFGNEKKDGVVETLEQHDNLKKWISIAKNDYVSDCYRFDRFMWYPLTGEGEYDHLIVSMDYVILSITGKIFMECYAELFDFFARLIRERMPDLSIADGIVVGITN